MLSESLQELLSAYVDGELAPTEYERVMAALRDSAIARDYVTELRSLSTQLKALPACKTPPDLTRQFLQDRKRERLQKRNWQWMSAAALAASLLIAIGIWWVVNRPVQTPGPANGVSDLARNSQNPDRTAPLNTPVVPERRTIDFAALAPFMQATIATAYDQWDQFQERMTGTMDWLTRADAIREGRFREGQSTLLTGPMKSTGSIFKSLDAPLPLLFSPQEFNPSALQHRWAKRGLFVLDISSKDTISTMSRLIDSSKDARINLMIDDEVKERLAKKLPATFMIYLENATEDQNLTWFNAMQSVDYWKNAELRSEVTCKSLILYPLDTAGRSQVARSLGLPAEHLATPKQDAVTSKAVALSYYSYRLPNSLSDSTRQAVASLQGPRNDRLSLVVLIRPAP